MKSLWDDTVKMPEFPSLEGDISTDVLIIGGGMAGILTAYLLHKKGINCVLAEKEKICCGITHNTTAKITFQHGLIYHKILENYGAQKARMYLKANRAAFDKFAEICKVTDCDYEAADNYIFSRSDEEALRKEIAALDKIGYKAEFCGNIPLPVQTCGAVKFPGQAQFNPMKFSAEISSELNIYEHTLVREMIGKTAVTDKGKIKAKKVVVATHFPFINKHGSYFLKLYQHRSYIIALENAEYIGGMYADENKAGLSFRNYGNLLLIGGGGHRTGKSGGGPAWLRRIAKEIYPKAREKYFWAAQDCISLDDIPYIGNYSAQTPDMYVASGFNKWGMTSSMTAAMILRDMIIEKENPCAPVFNPSRSILQPQLAVNGFEAAVNLLTPFSKRCPHMGCALKWNPYEHSWDCPCHGSRFTRGGKVTDNPANGNLR